MKAEVTIPITAEQRHLAHLIISECSRKDIDSQVMLGAFCYLIAICGVVNFDDEQMDDLLVSIKRLYSYEKNIV